MMRSKRLWQKLTRMRVKLQSQQICGLQTIVRGSFMVITAHYISHSWTLESRVISFFLFLFFFIRVILLYQFLDSQGSLLTLCFIQLTKFMFIFFRFIHFPSPHDKYSLSKVFLECFSDLNIDSKLSAITVDNSSNNDDMMKLVSDKLQASSLILGEKLLHVLCSIYSEFGCSRGFKCNW